MTASLMFSALAGRLTRWSLRNAGARFAALKAASAATDLYRTDVPFLLKVGRRTEAFRS